MIALIYKVCHKIYMFFYKRYIVSKLQFTSKHAKKTIKIVSAGINIWNKNVIVGENVVLFGGATFWGDGEIVIGNNVHIGLNQIIYASNRGGVTIGDGVRFAAYCYVIDMNHGQFANEFVTNKENIVKPVEIGKGCWIGVQSILAAGTKLGNYVTVGANSFVNKEFSDNLIIAGTPAKMIKNRSERNKI